MPIITDDGGISGMNQHSAMLFDQTIRGMIAQVARRRPRSAMASTSAARIAIIAAIDHPRIVLDVASFLAPAQIKFAGRAKAAFFDVPYSYLR